MSSAAPLAPSSAQEAIIRLFARKPFSALFCLIGGSLSACAMAPMNAWYSLFLALPVFYIALHCSPSKRWSFLYGWIFGFGYFVFGLYWIGNALLVEGNPYQWAWPLAVAGLPAFLAIFWGLAAVLIRRFFDLGRLPGWLAFCAGLTLIEWIRGHIFTGFPWNLFGYTWSDHLEILQILGLGDVYLLTFLTIIWASALALLLLAPKADWKIAGGLALLSFAGVHAFGAYSLNQNPDLLRDDFAVRLVQPNISQEEKWDRALTDEHFAKHIELSRSDVASDKPTYILWPETAISYRQTNDPVNMSQISSMLEAYQGGAGLITGLLRFDSSTRIFSNSLVFIDWGGTIKNVYDKHHLVPFGEYIPFQRYIPLRPIVEFSGFQPGEGLKTEQTPEGFLYSPLVCYEIIFPGRMMAPDQPRPDFIANVTNDAWYGISPGPYQHFIQAQFRAVESGVPVVRAANTGFSGLIAPSGRILERSDLMVPYAKTVVMPSPSQRLILSPQNKLMVLFGVLGVTFFLALFLRHRTRT